VLILAGAGSGKTRTITHRIAYACAVGSHRPEHALAVTFTAKAAGQMRARLAALGVAGVAVSTFHAAALRQLRYFWPKAVGGPAPKLLTAKAPLLAEAAAALGLPRDRVLVRDLAAEVEWAKVSRLPLEGYVSAAQSARRTPPGQLTYQEVAAAYGAYGDLLAERGLMDFEDVLLLTAALLDERADLAEQVRQRYRWITVDEYQDVSAVQQALLKVWLGDSDEVCVVGDPGQTIYTFAGASAQYLQSFPQWYPQAAVVPLARSYRCSPQIVSAANRLLGARRVRSALPALRLASAESEGPAVTVRAFTDDIAEAEGIAAAVRSWREAGVPLREMAVLVRSNAATGPIEDALAEAGIGYVLTGGERFFSRREIKEATARLRGAAKAGSGGRSLTLEVAEVLAAMGFHEDLAPAGRGAARERWESLAALAALAADVARRSPHAGVADLVSELQRRAELEAEPTADGVSLATLHAAKGLEWDRVWIAGVQEGSLPISYADTVERIEEERRLCYVGITRARRELILSWSAARSGERAATRKPSRFLRDLAESVQFDGVLPPAREGSALRPRSAPSRARNPRIGSCRICGKGLPTPTERAMQRCRTCPSDIDPALLQRLQRWRADTIAATGVPAYTVFTDLTLQAIAELRPTTSEQLLAITGVGPDKLQRYGAHVLTLVGRDTPTDPPADTVVQEGP
jgi:DNA helicase-2/ATP-dependent DNA helicase PcrA